MKATPKKLTSMCIRKGCDICMMATAKYDAPLLPNGSWAHVCEHCYEERATPAAATVGFRLRLSPPRKRTRKLERDLTWADEQ